MARHQNKRTISCTPDFTIFKPKGCVDKKTEIVHLALDELEAIKLIDLQGLYHKDAAVKMCVSRATAGRIVETARKKISDAIVNGKILSIGGGEVNFDKNAGGKCVFCPLMNDDLNKDNIPEKCKICLTTK